MTAALIVTAVPLLSILAGYVASRRGRNFDPRWYARGGSK